MANSLCRSCTSGTASHCPAQFKRQGSGAEQPSPTHKVQEPKAVFTDTQQHPVVSSPLMLKLCPPLTASQLSEPASCCLPGMWCHPKWPSTSESGTCWAESSRHTWVPTLLGKKKESPWLKLHFKDQPFVTLRTTVLPGLSIWFLSHLWSSEWQI